MKRYWKDIVLISIGVLIIIPLITALMMNVRLICVDTANDWIGFWGSYFGAILGAGIAIYVMQKTLTHEREIRNHEEKCRFLELLIEKSAAITKYNKYLLSEIKFEDAQKSILFKKDKKAFLNACGDFNQCLDELDLIILVGDHSGNYSSMAELKNSIKLYSKTSATVIDILRKDKVEDDELKKQLYFDLQLMTSVEYKFKSTIKNFIKANTL